MMNISVKQKKNKFKCIFRVVFSAFLPFLFVFSFVSVITQ